MLDFREAASATSGQRREATAYVAYKLTDVWKAQAYALKGFARIMELAAPLLGRFD
jgi:hypothetical protein